MGEGEFVNIDYANAVETAQQFADELERLCAAHREHILKQFLSDLPFCRYCGFSDCRGTCEKDE